MKYLFLVLLVTNSALAIDWLCTEEASQRKGNAIWACGIGSAKTENEAREIAFRNAKLEFLRVCESSDDCRYRRLSVEPRRTECRAENGFTCYRLVVFTIKPSPAELEHRAGETGQYLRRGMSREDVIAFMGMPVMIDRNWSSAGDTLFLYKDHQKCMQHECFVIFGHRRNRLDSWSGIKPAFTEDVH